MVDIRKEIKEAINYAKYVAKSKKHHSFIMISVGFLLLIEHILMFGTPWHTEQLIFDHGFIGFILIIVGFVYGSYYYWKERR